MLTLLAARDNCAAISKRLWLSRETVHTHARNARSKIGAHTIALAIRQELI